MGTFWENLGKKFGETAETVTNKAGEMVEIQKLKSQIRALENGNESDYVDLGRMVYEQFKNGAEVSVEASGLCEAIQSREESIREYEKMIVDVKGDFSCPSCGKTVVKGMSYCPYCGERFPEDLKEMASEYAEELKEKAADFAEKAAEKADDLAEKVENLAEKAADKVENAAEKVTEKLTEKSEEKGRLGMGILVLISITLCLALIDITVKSTIEGDMTQKEERTACKGKVILRKVYNRGFGFNLCEKKEELVKYGSAIAATILTIWQLFTLMCKKQRLRKWGLSLMTAGAWSNTFDRWFRGYVIDYVGFQTKWKKVTAITFNLADFLIGAGGVLVVLSAIFHKKRK